MRLKILALAVLGTLSINAYSQEGNVETNSVVSFKNATASHFNGDRAETKTDNASGHVGETIHIKTKHSFSIKNDSKVRKNYTVAQTCRVNGKEYKKGWGFGLSPREEKNFAENVYLDYQANEAGSWTIESSTCVANSGACSSDRANLTVN